MKVQLDVSYFEFRNTLLGAIAVAEGAMEMPLVDRLRKLLESVEDDA